MNEKNELEQITELKAEYEAKLEKVTLELEEKDKVLETIEIQRECHNEFANNLLDHSPDSIWVVDRNKRFITFNKMAEEITGYAQEKIIGQPLSLLFDQESHYYHLLDSLEVEGNLKNIRTTIKKKNGEEADLLMSLSLLREQGTHGKVIGTVTISKDVTRELRLESALSKANERLEENIRKRTQDLEILSQSLVVVNQIAVVAGQRLEVKMLLENILKLVLELTGFTMGAVSIMDEHSNINLEAHLNLSDVICQRIASVQLGNGLIGIAAESGFLQMGMPIAPNLQDVGVRLIVAVPLRAMGNLSGVMSLFTETPRDMADEERDMLLAIGIQVAGAIENGKLYEQVQKDIEQLREVDRIKSEFIATISHELRTPLTSIIGFLSYALMDFNNADPAKIKRYINIGLMNGQKLANMIEDLLAMQKIESGTLRLRLEPMNLLELLDDITKDLSPQLQSKKQVLVINSSDDFPEIVADKEQLERIFTNLITNAVKFSDEPGKVVVTCNFLASTQEYQIEVKDSGIGMSAETCGHIFDRFYQAENTLTRKAGGTGLGLTIVKRIVEIHQGKIEVKSKLSKGSSFTITMPVCPVLPEGSAKKLSN